MFVINLNEKEKYNLLPQLYVEVARILCRNSASSFERSGREIDERGRVSWWRVINRLVSYIFVKSKDFYETM